jgi:ATP-binding cassette subfamily C (CFTR/MRP) protein 1
LDWVLKNLTLKIQGGTKVGIVGRTGAGKSTLMSAIYKTFENYKGEILIDGREISSIDLKVLRKSITIIPQDPHLFEDTLR